MGKVLSHIVVMEGQESLIPKYSQGLTTIVTGSNLRKTSKTKLQKQKEEPETLTEQEKLAVFANRY